MVSLAHQSGFPVAIHSVEAEAVAAAAEAIRTASPISPREHASATYSIPNDRIEHCSEGTPEALEKVLGSGASVVTQPGFIYWNGDSYRANVGADLLPHLYPISRLINAGVALAELGHRKRPASAWSRQDNAYDDHQSVESGSG